MNRRTYLVLVSLLAACGPLTHESDADVTGMDGSAPSPSDASVPADGRPPGSGDGSTPTGRDGSLPFVGACVPRTHVPCACPDGLPSGWAECVDGEVSSECECGVPPAADGPEPPGGCTNDPEWCDGYDNDCDGVVDNGHVCPDSSVANAVPFTQTVWLLGWQLTTGCQYGDLQRIYPTVGTERRGTLPCGPAVGIVRIRPGDQAIHYGSESILRDVDGPMDEVADNPPCYLDGAARAAGFAFGPGDQLHYRCENELRRGNGERVTDSFPWHIEAVLSSGRILATRMGQPVLFDTDGSEISRAPYDEFIGEMRVSPDSASTEGDHGFIAATRSIADGRREVVVFRVDGDGTWSLVRRVRSWFWHAQNERLLTVSDGTVFYGALAFPPDAAPRYLLDTPAATTGPRRYYYELTTVAP